MSSDCLESLRQCHVGRESRPAAIPGRALPRPPWATLTCDEIVHKGGRHAEDAHQQVTDGQVENEYVGDSAHVPVLEHDETDQGVAHHAEEEDEHVGHDEHGCHWGGVLVVGEEGEVGGWGGLRVTPVLAWGPAAVGRLGGRP